MKLILYCIFSVMFLSCEEIKQKNSSQYHQKNNLYSISKVVKMIINNSPVVRSIIANLNYIKAQEFNTIVNLISPDVEVNGSYYNNNNTFFGSTKLIGLQKIKKTFEQKKLKQHEKQKEIIKAIESIEKTLSEVLKASKLITDLKEDIPIEFYNELQKSIESEISAAKATGDIIREKEYKSKREEVNQSITQIKNKISYNKSIIKMHTGKNSIEVAISSDDIKHDTKVFKEKYAKSQNSIIDSENEIQKINKKLQDKPNIDISLDVKRNPLNPTNSSWEPNLTVNGNFNISDLTEFFHVKKKFNLVEKFRKEEKNAEVKIFLKHFYDNLKLQIQNYKIQKENVMIKKQKIKQTLIEHKNGGSLLNLIDTYFEYINSLERLDPKYLEGYAKIIITFLKVQLSEPSND